MSQVIRWFHEGGFAMFPILFLGVVGLAGTVAGLVVGGASRRRGTPLAFGIALLAVALLCGGLGGASYLVARQRIDAALTGVALEHREKLRAAGESEGRVALNFGGGAAALPALGGLVLVALGLARGREPDAGT
jgi:hypothetical protein